mmetsp:Transcript_18027/g.42244  ORF Transcript_18027/g.42244 Transcript_18027/m.42244 type:complete len:345 (-) Transcript_18027:49-1083(-)
MMAASRADKWRSAVTTLIQLHPEDDLRPVSAEILRQIEMDMARTHSMMLVGHEMSAQEEVEQAREKVTHLLIKWLQTQTELTYSQGMNNMMATCFRELKDEEAALQVFDFMLRQANQNLYHIEAEKLVAANNELSEMLWARIREESPKMAQRLAGMDVDFLPIIVQTWLTDLFVHAMPPNAAAQLWDHFLDFPGVPLKFATQLLLSGKQAILDCEEEELQELLLNLPNQVQGPEDVDRLLKSNFADGGEEDEKPPIKFLVSKLMEPEEGVEHVHIKTMPRVKMPRRWQPWKLVSVAMAIPWLLTHVTQPKEVNFSRRAPPPMLRRASVPAIVHLLPMHEANWPN